MKKDKRNKQRDVRWATPRTLPKNAPANYPTYLYRAVALRTGNISKSLQNNQPTTRTCTWFVPVRIQPPPLIRYFFYLPKSYSPPCTFGKGTHRGNDPFERGHTLFRAHDEHKTGKKLAERSQTLLRGFGSRTGITSVFLVVVDHVTYPTLEVHKIYWLADRCQASEKRPTQPTYSSTF